MVVIIVSTLFRLLAALISKQGEDGYTQALASYA